MVYDIKFWIMATAIQLDLYACLFVILLCSFGEILYSWEKKPKKKIIENDIDSIKSLFGLINGIFNRTMFYGDFF